MSNLRISKKTFILIIFLILLVIILLVLKILQGKNPPAQLPPIETITPTTTVTSPTPSSSCSPSEKTRGKFPFVTPNYTIQYLPVPKKFFVMILANPYEKYKDEAEKWLTSYGIDPNGPCVFWTSAKGVAPKTQ